MKTQLKFIAAAATLLLAGAALAQSAGTWMARAGVTKIAPSVTSGCMSAPDYGDSPAGCTKSDIEANTQLSGGITYMYTDNWSVDLPLALPFKHNIIGAGSMAGAGKLGDIQAAPLSVFLQYRFMEAQATVRPYVGLGVSYAYYFNPTGSGKLTATTNPGGPPTTFTVDSKFALAPQIGATIAIDKKWFVDLHYSKSNLSTTTKFSTGQQMDVAVDPAVYGLEVGMKF